MKIKFYKYSKSLFWRCISLKQRLNGLKENAIYTHVEAYWEYNEVKDQLGSIRIFWPYNKEIYTLQEKRKAVQEHWLWFSSSEQDNWTRFKTIIEDKNHWSTIDIWEDKNLVGFKFYKSQDKKFYNKLWIFFAQILNLNYKGLDDWFCSEIITVGTKLNINMILKEFQWGTKEIVWLFTSPWELIVLLLERGYSID